MSPIQSQNIKEFNNPTIGSYWHERCSTYFIIVDVDGPFVTFLNVRLNDYPVAIDYINNLYDYSLAVTAPWEEVRQYLLYNGTKQPTLDSDFVADVQVPEISSFGSNIAHEWRQHEIETLQKKFNRLTGWTTLSSENN